MEPDGGLRVACSVDCWIIHIKMNSFWCSMNASGRIQGIKEIMYTDTIQVLQAHSGSVTQKLSAQALKVLTARCKSSITRQEIHLPPAFGQRHLWTLNQDAFYISYSVIFFCIKLQCTMSSEMEVFLVHQPITFHGYSRLFAQESRRLWQLSASSIVVSVSTYLLTFVTLIFAGHLGSIDLAGASIACVGIQGFAYGIMLGMASAVQTVCGQAYGAGNYSAMGVILQRAVVLHTAAAVLLSFLYWYSGSVLKTIGQSEAIAENGQIFSRGMIVQLYAFAVSCPMQRFLQAQNIVNPLAYIAVGVLLFHALLTWLAVTVLKFGLLGASLTLGLSWWLLVLFQGLYILLSPSCIETWTGFSLQAFIGIWPFIKLTIASAVMLCLEIWYNQGLVLLSGLLPYPTIALDSISVCMNYLNWDIEFMLGLAASACVRVSNELGAAHPMVARFSVMVVSSTSILISAIFSAVVLISRDGLSKVFTSNSQVIAAVSKLIPLLAISVFLNGLQPILSGVAIGSGRQSVVAYVNLVTYYVIGLPIGCVLGFKTELGVAGIWWGMVAGVFLQTVTLIVLTARTDWNAEVTNAANRIQNSATATATANNEEEVP